MRVEESEVSGRGSQVRRQNAPNQGRVLLLREKLATLGLILAVSCLGESRRSAGLALQSGEARPRAESAAQIKFAASLQQIQQLIERGDLAQARSQLTQALKVYPREAGLHSLLGVVDAQEGKYRAAESSFETAIKEDPHLTGAYLNLGRLYQENVSKDPNALQKGVETYDKLLRFEPNHIEAIYQSAVLLELRGKFKESLDRLSRLPAESQSRAQALAVRCAGLAGLGDRSRADAVASQLLASPDLTEADILSIVPALESRRRDDLEALLLEGLVQRKIASLSALHQLGVLYERRGELQKARATLEAVAEGQPNSTSPLVELARVANLQRDYKGALGYLAHARDLEPENAGIHFFFGMVCVEENLAQEAYNSLKKAVSLEPGNPYYNYALGAVASDRTDAGEAIPYFKKYCELKPRDPRGHFALGAAYFYSHDYESAKRELEAVIAARETAAGAHYFLGRIANQEGKLDLAVRELQQAIEANSKHADAYAELGHVLMNLKDHAAAEKALQHAVELEPFNYGANFNLMILYQRTKDPRSEAQTRRFEEIRKERSERAKEFLRTIEVRP